MLTVVLLVKCLEVGDSGWPNSWRVSLNILPSLIFKNNAPAAYAAKKVTMLQSV